MSEIDTAWAMLEGLIASGRRDISPTVWWDKMSGLWVCEIGTIAQGEWCASAADAIRSAVQKVVL